MILFINDRPIQLVGPQALQKGATITTTSFSDNIDYEEVIDVRLGPLKSSLLRGRVLILNATPAVAEKLVYFMHMYEFPELLSVKVVALDKKATEEKLKSLFKLVKAAGGVVFKDDKMLFIFRRGKWDLPKGKLDERESSREAARREVIEETGVEVILENRICTTWHTYLVNGKRILKRTKWYQMVCVDDSKMAPQAEEDIQQIEWMDRKRVRQALANSFSSIRYVIEAIGQKEINE